jgi:hypothetical protein
LKNFPLPVVTSLGPPPAGASAAIETPAVNKPTTEETASAARIPTLFITPSLLGKMMTRKP